MTMKRFLLKVVLLFLIAITLTACSGKPSENDARKALEDKVNALSGGLIKVVGFHKTNARHFEVNGLKFYSLEYEAEIEFVDDCYWSTMPGNFYRADKIKANVFYGERAQKGQRTKVNGKTEYEMTEKGWRRI